MRLEQTSLDGIVTIRPGVPQLNASVAGAFRAAVTELIETGEHHLVLDLTGVEFIDSSALGAIVGILKTVEPLGGHLLLCSPGKTVHAMMEVTRMTRLFPLYADADAARAAILESTT